MTLFEIATWLYLGIGFVVFVIEFRNFDDSRKWIVFPVPLLFVTWLWPWVLLVDLLDLTRKRPDR
jgi:hypothetical protein